MKLVKRGRWGFVRRNHGGVEAALDRTEVRGMDLPRLEEYEMGNHPQVLRLSKKNNCVIRYPRSYLPALVDLALFKG
jgi:hypothetical protein